MLVLKESLPSLYKGGSLQKVGYQSDNLRVVSPLLEGLGEAFYFTKHQFDDVVYSKGQIYKNFNI
jgi:hypothetical protein